MWEPITGASLTLRPAISGTCAGRPSRPIGYRTRGYILTKDQSDAGRAELLRSSLLTVGHLHARPSRPIGYRTRGYILMTDHSDAGRTGIFSRRTNRI
eukprot:9493798-Pyramimonas_sp.AAC.1